MDPDDSLNQENRKLDSKMKEHDSNNEVDQNRNQHSQNFFFESRESFDKRMQQINSGI